MPFGPTGAPPGTATLVVGHRVREQREARRIVIQEQVGAATTAGWDDAVRRVTGSIAGCGVHLDGLRMRLTRADGRIVAQANARAAGRPVRVQVAAATPAEAADDLAERLSRRALEAAGRWSARPWPDADDASVPSRLPPAERVVGLALLTRIKPVALAECPPEVAATVMDLMDYPAHLFVDADTGLDAVVFRAGPSGYRLTRLRPAPPPAPNSIPLTVDPRPAPVLTPERAMARLDETGLGHLFFTDLDTGRGHLVYRRFDTRYALLKDGR